MCRPMLMLCVTVCILKITPTGACTFPSSLTGYWEDSAKGSLLFSSTTFRPWTVSKQGSFVFTCLLNVGNVYISKSETFNFLGLVWNAYLCMDMKQLSSDLYFYNLGSGTEPDAGYDKIKIFVTGTVIDLNKVCDNTAYTVGSNKLLLKKDSISNVRTSCPRSLRGYWQYTIDNGTGSQCGGRSYLDVCSLSDGLTFNRTYCSNTVAYSSTGVLLCVYSVTSGDSTYVTLYNTDSTIDGSSTFRYTCMVYTRSGTTVLMSQYPSFCIDNQTSTSVMSPGATLMLTSTNACPLTRMGISTAAVIGLSVFFAIVIIILLVIAFVLVLWRQQKKHEEKARGNAEHAQKTARPDVVDGIDGVEGRPLTSRSVVLNVSVPPSREGEADFMEENKAQTYHVIGIHPGSVNDQIGTYVGRKKKTFAPAGEVPGKAPSIADSQRGGGQRAKAVEGQHLPPIVEDGSGGAKGKLVRTSSNINNRIFPQNKQGQVSEPVQQAENGAAMKRNKPIPVRQLKKTSDDKKQMVKRVSKSRIPKEAKETDDEDDFYVPPATPIKVTRVDIPALLANPKGGRMRDVVMEVVDLESAADSKTSVQTDTIKEQPEFPFLDRERTKLWLEPKPAVDEDVWSKVSNLWKLGQIWQEKADKL